MFSWFDALPLLEKIFYYMALPATAIIIIQTIMLVFSGFGSDQDGLDTGPSEALSDLDIDFEADLNESGLDFSNAADASDTSHGGEISEQISSDSGIKFVTIRGIITFFAITGWTGILFMEFKFPDLFSIILALVFGVGAMVTVAYLVRALMRLDASGNRNYTAALGQVCDVYLTIPAGGKGSGKVTMSLGGRFSEYEAITACEYPIKTGELARVVDIVGVNIMVVEPENAEHSQNEIPL